MKRNRSIDANVRGFALLWKSKPKLLIKNKLTNTNLTLVKPKTAIEQNRCYNSF